MGEDKAYGLDSLGSLKTLLSGGDDDLRSKYMDYLSTALSPESIQVEPDSTASFMQGVLPALAVGLFTGGKGLQYAGDPLASVYKNQQELAQKKSALSIETNLKKANLVGDELGRREKIAADEWDKVEAAQLKRELQGESIQARKDIAAQSDDTRRDIAGMMAASRSDANADRDAARTAQEENRQRDDQRGDTEKVDKAFRERLKDKKIPERMTALNSARSMLDADNNIAAEQLRGLLVGIRGDNRKSNLDILRAVPETFKGTASTILNKIDGGDRSPIQPEQKKALLAVFDVYEKEIKKDAIGAKKGVVGLADNLAPTLKKMNQLDSVLSSIGGEYGVGNLDDTGRTFTLPSGATATEEELLGKGYNIDRLLKEGKIR